MLKVQKDFVHKLNIALKEADETQYWLNCFFSTEFINKIFQSIKTLQSPIK